MTAFERTSPVLTRLALGAALASVLGLSACKPATEDQGQGGNAARTSTSPAAPDSPAGGSSGFKGMAPVPGSAGGPAIGDSPAPASPASGAAQSNSDAAGSSAK